MLVTMTSPFPEKKPLTNQLWGLHLDYQPTGVDQLFSLADPAQQNPDKITPNHYKPDPTTHNQARSSDGRLN